MSTAALSLPDLPSQPHQGVGARLVRRLGGAVRSAITGGMTLATGRRRPAAPQPDIDHPVARDPDPRPAPAPEHLPGQPRTASPFTPDRSASPGWLARLSGRGRRPTRFNYALLPDGDAPFTPEAFPGLTPEFCTFLNTPLEECDPEMLTSAICRARRAHRRCHAGRSGHGGRRGGVFQTVGPLGRRGR